MQKIILEQSLLVGVLFRSSADPDLPGADLPDSWSVHALWAGRPTRLHSHQHLGQQEG